MKIPKLARSLITSILRKQFREVETVILGSQLILVNADDNREPTEVFRIGSLPIIFPDGEKLKIKVFGFLADMSHLEQRKEFEKLLRKECEKSEVLLALFGKSSPDVIAKRFNPSGRLNDMGWRRDVFSIHPLKLSA